MQHRAASFRVPALVQDVLLALFITVMQVQGTVSRDPAEMARPLTDLGNLGYLLLIVSGVVVAGRRRWPVPVFVTAGLASLAYYSLDFPDGPGWLGLFVALYTLTAYGDGRRSLVIAGVGITVLSIGWLVAATDIEPPEAIGWVFFRIGASVMSAALGESVRSRRFIAAEAQERAERAERTREEEARSRVDAERLRIAREVHDTVAHAIAIINVQAGVTAHVLDKRPDRARETLVAIERTSSQALQEMRAILGVLRDADDRRVPHPDHGVDSYWFLPCGWPTDPPLGARHRSWRPHDLKSSLIAEVHSRNRRVIEAELDRLARRVPTLTCADPDVIDAVLVQLSESLILSGLRNASQDTVPLLKSPLGTLEEGTRDATCSATAHA
jgi:hypothetical protein